MRLDYSAAKLEINKLNLIVTRAIGSKFGKADGKEKNLFMYLDIRLSTYMNDLSSILLLILYQTPHCPRQIKKKNYTVANVCSLVKDSHII